MFLLNTILAWNINIIMNKKYDNNNIIIASRDGDQGYCPEICSLPEMGDRGQGVLSKKVGNCNAREGNAMSLGFASICAIQ
jgi:hypothetical protein